MNNFILYWKHFFDKYKIYKIGNMYVVKDFWGHGIDRDGGGNWYSKYGIKKYCTVKSCEEAHNIIKLKKDHDIKTNLKYKFASDCYK